MAPLLLRNVLPVSEARKLDKVHPRLQGVLLAVSEREQRRIGQDLHDSLGQLLTGIALLCRKLKGELDGPYKADAESIERLTAQAMEQTRGLARALCPPRDCGQDAAFALGRWASEIRDLFGVSCTFQCDRRWPIHDPAVSNHLFRIAQEAVTNAIRHGRAKHISIHLGTRRRRFVLTVQDNGVGFPGGRSRTAGMGIPIMRFRAQAIGGSLRIRRSCPCGTTVTCAFPQVE